MSEEIGRPVRIYGQEIDRLWDETRNYLTKQNSHLQGRLLTQLEASMPKGRQLEALKEIVSNILWETSEDKTQILFGLFKEYVQSSKITSVTFEQNQE